MRNLYESVVRVAAVLLVALSAIAILWSAQQYLIVGSLKGSMQSVAALEDSLLLAATSKLTALQADGATLKSIESEAEQLRSARLSVIEAASRAQRLHFVDVALWGAVFVLSALTASHHLRWRKFGG